MPGDAVAGPLNDAELGRLIDALTAKVDRVFAAALRDVVAQVVVDTLLVAEGVLSIESFENP